MSDLTARVTDPIGCAWLAREYDIEPVQPFRILSRISPSRTRHVDGNFCVNGYLEPYRPEPSLTGHLEFALKHEAVHLEFCARLFAVAGHAELSHWAQREPTGAYARRAGFLYEWLTGRTLDFEGVRAGSYVDALDARTHFAATDPANVPRWRVRDNLPGTPEFCPTVLLTPSVQEAAHYDVRAQWHALEEEFGPELLARSAVWLTTKESRASFAIEGEADQRDRVQRFAAAMERYVGAYPEPLAEDALAVLQRSILGERALRYGRRRSPIFVGESEGAFEIVHYVAPHWDHIPGMLHGLAATDRRTTGHHPVLRAAVLSFGFVYVHPLSDGNGRVSRFLVNDVLRRDGAVPPPFVLPISAAISDTAGGRRDYDRALETVSKPLMARYRDAYRFGSRRTYEDGLESDFEFLAYDDAAPVWRYLDLTDHARYTFELVRTTLQDELRTEARQLRAYRRARQAVKEIVEGPDPDLDRIVRAVRQNGWTVSGKLTSEFPILRDASTAAAVADAVRHAMEEA